MENLTFCVHPSDGNIVVSFLLKTALLLVSFTFVLFPSYQCPWSEGLVDHLMKQRYFLGRKDWKFPYISALPVPCGAERKLQPIRVNWHVSKWHNVWEGGCESLALGNKGTILCFRGIDRLVSDLTAGSLESGSSRAAEELPLLLDELN